MFQILEYATSIMFIFATFLLIKKNIIYWYLNITGSVVWFLMFLSKNLYMAAGLQVSIIIMCIYSIISWKKLEKEHSIPKNMDYAGKIMVVIIFIATLISTLIFTKELKFNNLLEFIGAITSIIASFYGSKQNNKIWGFLIIGNISFLILAFMQKLYPTSFTYLMFIILSIKGYFDWRTSKEVSNT